MTTEARTEAFYHPLTEKGGYVFCSVRWRDAVRCENRFRLNRYCNWEDSRFGCKGQAILICIRT